MSSFLDRIKQKMTGSIMRPGTKPKPAEKSKTAVVTNRWDERVWTEARKNEVIDKFIYDLSVGDQHKGGERPAFDLAAELVHDLFFAFYKANPTLHDKREVAKEAIPTRKIMEEILESPKLRELQEMTAMDPVMSTIAVDSTAGFIREIIARLPPPPPPPGGGGGGKGPKGEDEEEGEPGEPGGCGGIPVAGEPGEGEPEGDPVPGQGDLPDDLTDGPEAEFDLDKAHDEANQENAERDWEKDYEDLLDDLDLDRLANKALDKAEKDADELDNLRKGIGLEDGEWKTMSPEERLKLADTLNTPEMKALSDIIGKMKRFALGIKASRIVDVPHEIFDVEQGNDIRRLLKSQFVLLGHEDTKPEFYRRYNDRELLQYKKRGKEEVGKGPIIIAIDKSGSMNGEPFHWAMAVAEALRRFAADEDRDYYAMFFGANNDRERFDFPKGKAPFEKVLAFLSCQANGGTQFDGVLTEALARASRDFDASGTTKADIVFVTDGMAHLDPEWIKNYNAERERTGVRQYSVYIGGAYDMGYGRGGPQGLLEQISDAVITVKDLKPEAVEQIFQRV